MSSKLCANLQSGRQFCTFHGDQFTMFQFGQRHRNPVLLYTVPFCSGECANGHFSPTFPHRHFPFWTYLHILNFLPVAGQGLFAFSRLGERLLLAFLPSSRRPPSSRRAPSSRRPRSGLLLLALFPSLDDTPLVETLRFLILARSSFKILPSDVGSASLFLARSSLFLASLFSASLFLAALASLWADVVDSSPFLVSSAMLCFFVAQCNMKKGGAKTDAKLMQA